MANIPFTIAERNHTMIATAGQVPVEAVERRADE